MERLTEKQSAGYDLKRLSGIYCNIYCERQSIETCRDCGIYEAIQRLAEYEDTGLNPDEITALQEHLDISRAEVQGLSKKLEELQDQNNTLAYIVNTLNPLIMENYNLKKENREREYEKHTYSQKHDEVDPMQCVECGWESPDNCRVCRAERGK